MNLLDKLLNLFIKVSEKNDPVLDSVLKTMEEGKWQSVNPLEKYACKMIKEGLSIRFHGDSYYYIILTDKNNPDYSLCFKSDYNKTAAKIMNHMRKSNKEAYNNLLKSRDTHFLNALKENN